MINEIRPKGYKPNEEYRDYKFTYMLGDEKRFWFGSSRSLLEDNPKAKIINVKKLKKRV